MGQQPDSEQKPLIKKQHSAYDQISGAAPSAPKMASFGLESKQKVNSCDSEGSDALRWQMAF